MGGGAGYDLACQYLPNPTSLVVDIPAAEQNTSPQASVVPQAYLDWLDGGPASVLLANVSWEFDRYVVLTPDGFCDAVSGICTPITNEYCDPVLDFEMRINSQPDVIGSVDHWSISLGVLVPGGAASIRRIMCGELVDGLIPPLVTA